MNNIDYLIKNKLKDKEWNNPTCLKDLGYIFYGPLTFNFIIWLIKETENSDLILFNSREGYFLQKLYSKFQLKYKLKKTEYFKTSRRLSSMASFKSKSDVYETFKLHRYRGTLKDLLKNRFDIDSDRNEYVDTNKNIPNLEVYIDEILYKSEKIREEYKKYIDKVIDSASSITMVDSGYQGTTQYYLEKTYNLNLNGRYITYKGNLPLDNSKGFIDFYKSNFKKNIIFFESVFTDKVGTYFNIIDGVFLNEPNSQNQFYFNKKEEIVLGIEEFIMDMLKFDFNNNQINYEFSDNLFNLMCMKNYIKNDSLFSHFYQDNLFVKTSDSKIIRY